MTRFKTSCRITRQECARPNYVDDWIICKKGRRLSLITFLQQALINRMQSMVYAVVYALVVAFLIEKVYKND
jgi:hypothetical protein